MFPFLNEFAFRPWREWDRVHRNMNRLFSPTSTESAIPINVYSNQDGAAVVARIPGWKAEWFDISAEGKRLSIKGTVPEDAENPVTPVRTFQRFVNLPFDIDVETVKAGYRQGLLTLSLEKPEREKPKTIHVQVA